MTDYSFIVFGAFIGIMLFVFFKEVYKQLKVRIMKPKGDREKGVR